VVSAGLPTNKILKKYMVKCYKKIEMRNVKQ
jgi:hypothetical protein